jgi:uncharacterized damage-inducible protein DinB
MCYESNYTTNCAKSQMNRTVNNLLAYILQHEIHHFIRMVKQSKQYYKPSIIRNAHHELSFNLI